jgi:hypothetical protein
MFYSSIGPILRSGDDKSTGKFPRAFEAEQRRFVNRDFQFALSDFRELGLALSDPRWSFQIVCVCCRPQTEWARFIAGGDDYQDRIIHNIRNSTYSFFSTPASEILKKTGYYMTEAGFFCGKINFQNTATTVANIPI